MSAARRSTSIGRVVAAFTFATVIASTAFLGDPAGAKAVQPLRGLGTLLSLGSGLAAPFQPVLNAMAGTQAISSGSDGRLTVLLLGSDTRSGGISRTDTIMIMSLKGNEINVASIPRDTARIPNPFAGGTFKGRVNTIARQVGLANFEYVIEKLLNIEIDYYALINFDGFNNLVEEVEPVSINTQQVKDKMFWDDPKLPRGLYVPAMTNYQLYAWQPSYLAGNALCNGLWITKGTSSQYWCHRALDYVRSRKGSSDFKRARRQQDFVGAAINAVSSGEISAIVSTANAQTGAGALMTNIPFNSSAMELFNSLSGAHLANQVVFAPKAYSTHIPGTTAYQLKLSAVRAWTAIYMK